MSITEVTIKHCQWWGGVNDKVMALPRMYLEKSIGAVYPAMQAVMQDAEPLSAMLALIGDRSENTEQVVMWTLIGNRVPFRERGFEMGDSDGDDYLPFVDGRCYPSEVPGGQGRWCVVSHCKDCWPSQPWTLNVTCAVTSKGEKPPEAYRDAGVTDATELSDPDPAQECFYGIYR
ncbi:unnamed protein product [Prorocentrum cordatum]|nr:unnamed protein product [Polarella glacialis]